MLMGRSMLFCVKKKKVMELFHILIVDMNNNQYEVLELH